MTNVVIPSATPLYIAIATDKSAYTVVPSATPLYVAVASDKQW